MRLATAIEPSASPSGCCSRPGGCSQIRAGAVTLPKRSRRGRHLRTGTSGSTGPVRSFGPPRSISTRQRRPVSPARPAQVLDHPRPDLGVVVGAVDPHAVHAVREQVTNQSGVLGSLARHRHHHAHAAAGGRGAEQRVRVILEQLAALFEGEALLRLWRRCRPEALEHRRKRGEGVRLGAPEGGEPERREPLLQPPQILAPQPQIVHEVARAVAVGRVHPRQHRGGVALQFEHAVAQTGEFGGGDGIGAHGWRGAPFRHGGYGAGSRSGTS